MTWKTYAAGVSVSAGVLITGTLWYTGSGSPVIRGEDLAECYAAALERELVYMIGTNAPSWPTNNNITSFMEWRMVWDETMERMRDVAYRRVGQQSSDYVWWLYRGAESLPSEQPSIIAERNFSDYYYLGESENRVWHVRDNTNGGDSVVCELASFDSIDRAETNELEYLYILGYNAGMVKYYPMSFLPFYMLGEDISDGSFGTIVGRWKVDTMYGRYFNAMIDSSSPSGSGGGYFSDTACPWIDAGISTNKAGVYPSAQYKDTNGIWRLNKFVTTDKLDEVRKLANALGSRTIAVVRPYATDDTRRLIKSIHYSQTANYGDYPSWSDYRAAWEFKSVETNIYGGDLFQNFSVLAPTWEFDVNPEKLAECVMDVNYTYQDVTENRTTVYYYDHYEDEVRMMDTNAPLDSLSTLISYPTITTWKAYGAALPYPSEYALTNGYVSRVRVFAFIGHPRVKMMNVTPPTIRESGSYNYNNPPEYLWYDDYPTYFDSYSYSYGLSAIGCLPNTPNSLNSKVFGSGYAISSIGEPPDFSPGDIVESRAYPYIDSIPYTYAVANLVADVTDPNEYPVRVDFGVDTASQSHLDDTYQESSWTAQTSHVTENRLFFNELIWDDWYEEGRYCSYFSASTESKRLYSDHAMLWNGYFMVVVDWNWKHLNPDNPYVPETHIPAWMQ